MTGKRQQSGGGKPNPLVDRYTYITSVKAGNRTIAWLAIDRESKRVVVACPVGKARLLSLKPVRGLAPGHLAPIVRLLRTPDASQLPADLGSSRPVGIAIADYVPGDTLHARLKLGKLPPVDAVNLCAQVVRAVRAMHDVGTPHGAISPRAIVTSPKGKWSGPVVTQLIAPTSGAFSSRERLQKRGPSIEDDSWAAHATLHAALTAEGPFAGSTREELLQNMFGSKPRRLDEFGVNEPELQKIIDRGLVTNPRYRAKLEQLEKSLEKWLEEKGRVIQSMPPEPGGDTIFPKDDTNAIVFSEPPPSRDEPSAPLVLPRPHGKSLVGIVIDEPIDADAPAFAPPQRPEDLLDAVDDEDEGDDPGEDDATQIYDARRGKPLLASLLQAKKAPPPKSEHDDQDDDQEQEVDESDLEADEDVEPTESDAPPAPDTNPAPTPLFEFQAPGPEAPSRPASGHPSAADTKSKTGTGSGQALAVALALAVVAVVTLVVRFRSDSERVDVQPAASASAEVLAPELEQGRCMASYFPEASVDSSEDLGVICRAIDLRSTAKQLEKRLAAKGNTSKAAEAWSSLGWFELPLLASMRQNCCEKHLAERIVLPQPPPSCRALGAVVKQMTTPKLEAKDAESRARDFEDAARCLTEEKQASAYGQEGPITAENRRTFRSFLERAEQARKR